MSFIRGRFFVLRTSDVPLGTRHYDSYADEDWARAVAEDLNRAAAVGTGVRRADPFTEDDRSQADEWPWSVVVEVRESGGES